MNGKQFYKRLSSHALQFEERIDLLRTTSYNLSEEEDEPWCILQFFESFQYEPLQTIQALRIAQVFKERFGLIVIEANTSYLSNAFVTIMDTLARMSEHKSFAWQKKIKSAFEQTGFLYARDVDPRALYRLYIAHHDRFRNGKTPDGLYKPSPITEQLVEYLFQPRLIAKWISNGNDLEDYL